MKKSITFGAVAVLAAVGIATSGCGSDSVAGTSSSKSESSASNSPNPRSSAARVAGTTPAPGSNPTIADYVSRNGIVETTVRMGDLNAPAVKLPALEGWHSLTPLEAPDSTYAAMAYAGAQFGEGPPPTIVANMSWLNGNVDPKQILDLAPGEVRNLPGYEAGNPGEPSSLGEHPAFVLGGTYIRGGAKRMIAQKTVVISAADGLYVLRLTVDGPEEAGDVLIEATDGIDSGTTIG